MSLALEIKKTSSSVTKVYMAEIEWYKRHGKYNNRITKDIHGNLYVIGDWSWNKRYPDKYEYIENDMISMYVY